jgi:ribosome-dependent ATPase
MPFRAETVRGYLQGLHRHYLADPARGADQAQPPATLEVRFRYNQDFRSVYAMVPGIMALLLAMIPAILMALAVVREKELGSIGNLHVTPVTRLEFVLGKQLPYVAVAMLSFLGLVGMALLVFGVPLEGSFWTLALATLLYVTATTGYGLAISAFCRTQIAALFGTAILTILPAIHFSGMLTPVSSLSGGAAVMGRLFPMTYYLRVSVGTFTKALGFAELGPSLLALAAFVPAFTALTLLLLKKQER